MLIAIVLLILVSGRRVVSRGLAPPIGALKEQSRMKETYGLECAPYRGRGAQVQASKCASVMRAGESVHRQSHWRRHVWDVGDHPVRLPKKSVMTFGLKIYSRGIMGMPFSVFPSSVFLSSVSLSSVIPGPQGGTRKVDVLAGILDFGTSTLDLPDSLRAPE